MNGALLRTSGRSPHGTSCAATRSDREMEPHPSREERRSPYVTRALDGTPGPVIAVSDYMRAVQDQIALGGPYLVLAGHRRVRLRRYPGGGRRYFLVDAESIVVATLESLARDGLYDGNAAARPSTATPSATQPRSLALPKKGHRRRTSLPKVVEDVRRL